MLLDRINIRLKKIILIEIIVLIAVCLLEILCGRWYYWKRLFIYKYVDDDGQRIIELAYQPFTHKMHGFYYDVYANKDSHFYIEDSGLDSWAEARRDYVIDERDYLQELSEMVDRYDRSEEQMDDRRTVRVTYTYQTEYMEVVSNDMLFYSYGEDGQLEGVSYNRNPEVFGTHMMSGYNEYDKNGRVMHGEYYITHGFLEHFMVYDEDNETKIPDEVIIVDHDIDGIHVAVRYIDAGVRL